MPQIGERTWVDAQAEQFEREWRSGGARPRIEDYLAGLAGPQRAHLAEELVRVERELRQGDGEQAAPEEYHRRLPDEGAAVDAAFGDEPRADSARPTKVPVSAAQSLLFGLLALQNNFIDRDTLLSAFNAWIADKSRPLGQILLDRGALTLARHALLAQLVQEHLEQHGLDPERSLAVLTVVPAVRDQLQELPDIDIQAGLLALRLATTEGEADLGEATSDWDEETATTDAEGRFCIVRFHDRGALGEVFVARDQQLHRIVALKRIKLDHATDKEKKARFVVEAEITGRLEHPGIVPVYGLGTYDDGRPFYAMRFIRGDNLKTAIEEFHREGKKARAPGQRALALQKLLRRFLDVCNAIDYAHSRGVLHRDLKPGNIMLGKFGETLVVDWGLAKTVGRPDPVPASATLDDRTLVPQSGSDLRGTEVGARIGTPAYMSPEQAAGRIDRLGPASDVYSLGATLYSLLTGEPPFNEPDLAHLLQKVERGDFLPPRKLESWIDPALEAICKKAMATDPRQRYSTPRALADDMEHWLADEPVSAWREPFLRRVRRFGRRHRLLVASLAATLFVAVGALAVGNALVARQRDRAEQNLAFARRVVDEMYTGVADKLDDQKQMDDYQREILEKALRFYERIALPQSGDPQVRLEAARAGMRVGAIRSRLGRTREAEAAYRQALAVLLGIAPRRLSEPVNRDALAQAHAGLATLLDRQERWGEEEAELKQAEAIWDSLARDVPESADYRRALADAQADLSGVYLWQGRWDQALAEVRLALAAAERLVQERPDVGSNQQLLVKALAKYEKTNSALKGRGGWRGQPALKELHERAVAIYERLVRSRPDVARYWLSLAEHLSTLAGYVGADGDLPRAKSAVRRSIAILEKLSADHPQDSDIANMLAGQYAGMQNTLLFEGDLQSAVTWSGRAIPLLRSLARQDPGDLYGARRNLYIGLLGRAETLTRLGRHTDAIADYDEVRGLVEGTEYSELNWAFLALAKARVGDLSALSSQSVPIRRALKLGAGGQTVNRYSYYMTYYDAACVHAAFAKLQSENTKQPLSGVVWPTGEELDRALELLELARSSGEFRRMIRLDEVRLEVLLDPLRSHPRFQLLLMDLAFPDRPFATRGDQNK
jgi:serine/threonine-protein kinase